MDLVDNQNYPTNKYQINNHPYRYEATSNQLNHVINIEENPINLTEVDQIIESHNGISNLRKVLGATIIGLWIPGFEHDYINKVVNFHDFSKNYGAGYKTETLNQFVLADVVLCVLFSIVFLVTIIIVTHSQVDWNRMNKMAHATLAIFHGIGTVCAGVGIWNFEENCCRVDLEWNGLGFKFTPAVHVFGYPRNNYHCNCWLTRRDTSTEADRKYTTVMWDPQHNPDMYTGEESTFVSFGAHHIHIHVAALALMIVNTFIYFLAAIFSNPKSAS